jgi:WD40 repeat protein
VSFLSRIIGTKKKDPAQQAPDNESETGERRPEGSDVPVFSHPITSNGFMPHYPAPPKYIKVRTHNKKTPEFNRLFLAQELGWKGASKRNAGAAAEPNARHSAYAAASPQASSSAIWSLEFSVDGRFLAAGGQDRIVRVWAVISTPEEREVHEHEEVASAFDSACQAMRLNAPVFKSNPVREYHGHIADVLDLSWSKVAAVPLPPPSAHTAALSISCSPYVEG